MGFDFIFFMGHLLMRMSFIPFFFQKFSAQIYNSTLLVGILHQDMITLGPIFSHHSHISKI